MPKPKSKAQARLFGYIAGGGDGRFEKFPASEARTRLRGTKMSKLPEKVKKKTKYSGSGIFGNSDLTRGYKKIG